MGDHLCILRMMLGVLLQLCQKRLDLLLHLMATWARESIDLWRIKPPLQFNQPSALAFELPIAGSEGQASLHHGQQVVQKRMAPF